MNDFYTDNVAQVGTGAASALGSSVWWTLFWALLLFFFVYSAILLYHWYKFSMKRRTAITVTLIYIGVSALLLFIMLAGVVSLSIV